MHLDHDHPHEHSHDDSHGHSHSHSHEHSHGHSHSHSDSHGHSHDSCCGCGGGGEPSAKDLALLNYMLEHNKQHARELSDIGVRLSDSGASDAAKSIEKAVHYFDHANECLEKAVGLVGGGE